MSPHTTAECLLNTGLDWAHLCINLINLLVNICVILNLQHEVVVVQRVTENCALTQNEEPNESVVLQEVCVMRDSMAQISH